MSNRTIEPKTLQQATIEFRGASVLVTFVNNTGSRLTVHINEESNVVLVRVDEVQNEVRVPLHH